MPVPLHFTCPNCGREHHQVNREFAGKRIKCHCGQVLRLGSRGDSAGDSGQPSLPTPVVHELPSPTTSPHMGYVAPASTQHPPQHQQSHHQHQPHEPARPDYSLISPISPIEKKAYFETAIPPNYQTPGYVPPAVDVPVYAATTTHHYGGESSGGIGGALNVIGGIVGCLQGVVVGVILLVNLVKVIELWTSLGQGVEGFANSDIAPLRNQLMIGALLATVLLLMSIGLTIFASMMLVGGIQELNPGGNRRPDLAINAGVIAIGYNILLMIIVGVVFAAASGAQSENLSSLEAEKLTGTTAGAAIKLAIMSIVPFFLIVIAAIRAQEPRN